MQVHASTPNYPFHIRAYEPGEMYVNEICYGGSIIIFAEQINQQILPAHFEELTLEHIKQIAELAPELVLLGTGAKQKFIEHKLLIPLIKKKVGIEVMSTLSAARTYNLLVEEGRKVLGAFFL